MYILQVDFVSIISQVAATFGGNVNENTDISVRDVEFFRQLNDKLRDMDKKYLSCFSP